MASETLQNKRLNSGVFRPLRPGQWVVAPGVGCGWVVSEGPAALQRHLHPSPLRQTAGGQEEGGGQKPEGGGPGTVTLQPGAAGQCGRPLAGERACILGSRLL